MSRPHDPELETTRDAASARETPRPAAGPAPAAVAPGSVRVTDDGITVVGFDDPELRPLPHDKLHYHVPHPDPHPELHEHSDVPIRPLAITLGAIAATCVLTGVLLYWLFWNFKGQQEASERPRTAVPMAKPVVPEPRLQGVPGFSDNHPTQDMDQMRARYAAELESYAPNPGTPTARIPIDRAIDLALERNLFPVAGATKDAPTSRPSTGPSTRPAGQGGT